MKVSALFHRTVTSCRHRDTLDHAMALLWRHDIGCLPVLGDDGELIGMITDRDIAMAAFLQGAPLRSITVSSVMSKDVATCTSDDDIETVVQTLITRRIRRIPVVNPAGRLIGIISLNDVARAATAKELSTASVAAVLLRWPFRVRSRARRHDPGHHISVVTPSVGAQRSVER